MDKGSPVFAKSVEEVKSLLEDILNILESSARVSSEVWAVSRRVNLLDVPHLPNPIIFPHVGMATAETMASGEGFREDKSISAMISTTEVETMTNEPNLHDQSTSMDYLSSSRSTMTESYETQNRATSTHWAEGESDSRTERRIKSETVAEVSTGSKKLKFTEKIEDKENNKEEDLSSSTSSTSLMSSLRSIPTLRLGLSRRVRKSLHHLN